MSELRTLWALWTSFGTKCPARLSKPPRRALAGHFSGQSVQQDNCVRYGFLRSPDFAASCRLCRANRRIVSSSSLSASVPSSSWLPVGPRRQGFGTGVRDRGSGQGFGTGVRDRGIEGWVVASLDPTFQPESPLGTERWIVSRETISTCANSAPSPLRGGVRGGGKITGVAPAASPHPARHAKGVPRHPPRQGEGGSPPFAPRRSEPRRFCCLRLTCARQPTRPCRECSRAANDCENS